MTATDDVRLGLDAVDVDPGSAAAEDERLWSVTTILGVIDKPALKYWAAEQTANAAIDSLATWRAMLEDSGRPEAVKWLATAQWRRPKTLLSATNLGSVVHGVCESYALTGHRPTREEVAAAVHAQGGDQVDVDAETNTVGRMLVQFDGWLQRFSPAYQATEVCVYEPTYGYAGQSDGFLTIDGFRAIIDYKSSREPLTSAGKPKTPYPEQVGLQLAAYRHASYAAVWRPRRYELFRRRYYLLGESERALAVPVPEVDGGLCIHITPAACEAYPIRCDAEVHRAFLYTLECFRWVEETSKTAMGSPLEAAP
jgi:hypothetical protein